MVDMPIDDHLAPTGSGGPYGIRSCCAELMRLPELDLNQQPCD